MRSSTRRACWASTRCMSMSRGLAMACRIASFVISWKTIRFVFSGFNFKHLKQVPGDSLSLAVLIGSQPHHIGFGRLFFEGLDQLFLVGRNFVNGFVMMSYIDAEIFLFQITDMSVAREYLVILSQEFLYRFSLCRRLYDHQIFCHTPTFVQILRKNRKSNCKTERFLLFY